MTRFDRHPFAKWLLRAAFAFASAESSLALVAGMMERGVAGAGGGQDGAIVCIGDSNTAGVGAPRGKSYPDQLQVLLQSENIDVPIVNLGIAGTKTTQAVERLETWVAGATPRFVIVLTGLNDTLHTDRLFALQERPDESQESGALGWFSRLRTVSFLQTAWHVLRRDTARPEFGGQDSVDPEEVPPERRIDAYREAVRLGGQELFDWVSWYWRHSLAEEARTGWNEFKRSREYPEAARRFLLPVESYEWELAHLCGDAPSAVLAGSDASPDGRAFASFTRAVDLLRGGDFVESRETLIGLIESSNDQRFKSFLRVHHAWSSLTERRFADASSELESAAAVIEGLTPLTGAGSMVGPRALVGLSHSLGAAAVAAMLADPAVRLDAFVARHAASWKYVRSHPSAPNGKEWMAAAILLDAIKAREPSALTEAHRVVKNLCGDRPKTRVLSWLMANERASFEAVVADIPIDLPLIGWIGPNRLFFPTPSVAEMDRASESSFARIAELQTKHGFQVLLLTYLDYRWEEVNERLRRMTQRFGWTLVDLHSKYTVGELGADDKKKYFSPDRGHPNAAGYALVAAEVFDALKAAGLARPDPSPPR